MDKQLEQWRQDKKHLPEFLKDFHDQKDFFKYLHEALQLQDHDLLKDVSWIQNQVYTMDMLLFVLARYGWTLQRSRAHQNFDDLDAKIKEMNDYRSQQFQNILLNKMNEKKD